MMMVTLRTGGARSVSRHIIQQFQGHNDGSHLRQTVHLLQHCTSTSTSAAAARHACTNICCSAAVPCKTPSADTTKPQ
jgi:hypothetical protein